jgi:chemotaxis protein methyltransferase CheR
MQENHSSLVPGFETLSQLAYEQAGIVLTPKKAKMVQSRLRHRLSALQLEDLNDYCAYVRTDTSRAEFPHMISALTTNVSDFFREPHHFDFLTRTMVPTFKRKLDKGQKVRIWSAGCSRGQEPYSIAIMLAETDPIFLEGDCRILATDIDLEVLSHAMQGQYDQGQLSGLSEARKRAFFSDVSCEPEKVNYQISSSIRDMVAFKPLNLISDWPMRGKFDAIFCRNVVIYFDNKTQSKLWCKFHEKVDEDGAVFIGHSERIGSSLFRACGPTIYQPMRHCSVSSPNSLLENH